MRGELIIKSGSGGAMVMVILTVMATVTAGLVVAVTVAGDKRRAVVEAVTVRVRVVRRATRMAYGERR